MLTRKLNGFRTAVEHIESSTELIFSVTKALEIRLYSQKQGRGPNKLDGKQLHVISQWQRGGPALDGRMARGFLTWERDQ